MWWRMLSPAMLLTAVTAAIEQGAWGHYQLSNPPFLSAAFGYDAQQITLFFAIVPARSRGGDNAILPHPFSFVWRIPIGTENDSAE